MRSELVATWLLTLALHAGALLLLAWIVDRGAVRAQLAWRELLWRGALFGALLTASAQILLDIPAPARFALPVMSTAPVADMRPAIESPMPDVGAHDAARTQAIAAARVAPPARVTPPLAATAAPVADATARPSWRPSWQAVLVAAWLAGALLTLTRLAIAWLRLERQLADAQPIARSTLAADAAALAIAARTATPRVAAIDDLGSPIAATGRRIVLPRWALELLGREQLGAMLAHEIAHLARRDPQWKLLTAIWCGLLWFLPVTALARRRLDEIAELRCDHWAASHLGDGRVLAECLAECAGHHFDGIDASLAPAMAHRDSPLLQRIDHLIEGTPVNTNYSPLRAGICALFALALAAIILPGFGAARAQQAAPPARAAASRPMPALSTPPTPAPVVQATPAVSALPAAAAAPATAPVPDTLPTPPTAPVAPTPPTAPMPAVGGGNHLHVSSTTDASGRGREVTSVQISHDGERYSAKINGKVEFTQREDDIASLEDGGTASFAQTQAGVSRRVDFSSRGGTIERRYFVDGSEQPIDAQARAWIAALIPMVMRETAINAEARVKRIHATGGTGAVLDEIGRIESGYARGVYLKQLFGVTKLTPAETTRVIGLIDSIDSDYERRNALAALAAANPLDAAQQKLVLAQAAKIGSDYECAELLIGMLPKLAPGADVRAAWLQAAAGVGSDYEHRRVLSALLEAGNYDDATLAEVIGAAKSIGSDYERRALLVSAIERIGDADRIAPAYAAAAGDIDSDYEQREALVALIRAPKFGPAGARAVLDAASGIGSDFECREVLVELARVMPGDAGLIARYREVARGLSDFERGEAERALDRFAG